MAKSVPLKATATAKRASARAGDLPALPARLTYALKAYACERRADGWWIALTPFGNEKPDWTGGFASIETACLAIARRLATEVADRHTRHIEWHKIKPDDPLYGLKPTTRLSPKTGSSSY